MNIYQPNRKDLIINTQWGIPKHLLTKKEARHQKRKPYQERWVTANEMKQLKDQRHAYRSIRDISVLFIFMPLWIIILFLALHNKFPHPQPVLVIATIYSVISIVSGWGLFRYHRWARTLALLILLPLIPALVGLIGLYDLFRKTAGQIFHKPF